MAFDQNGQWIPDEGPAPTRPDSVRPPIDAPMDPDVEVLAVSPSGWRGSVKVGDFQKMAPYGWRLESPEETQQRIEQKKYGDAPVRTFLESAVGSATFGLADPYLDFHDPGGVAKRQGYNPKAAFAGSMAGALAPIPGTSGWAAAKAGEAVYDLTRVGKAARALKEAGVGAKEAASVIQGMPIGGRLAATALRGTAEGAVFGAGAGMEEAMLSKDPLNAEQFAASVGHGLVDGALLGGGLGAGMEAIASGARGARNWYRAFRGADGSVGPAGQSLETFLPKKDRIAILKDQEAGIDRALTEEIAARDAELATRGRAVDDLSGQLTATREERVAARDQFEIELGIMDEVAHQAESRAKLMKDVGGWPSDVIVREAEARGPLNLPKYAELDPEAVYKVKAGDLERAGLFELPGAGVDKNRMARVKSNLGGEEKWNQPIRLTVDDQGRAFIEDGRHRLRAALEEGGWRPLEVKMERGAPGWRADSGEAAQLISANGRKPTVRRLNPLGELVTELQAARADVQSFFPHAGETVTKKLDGKRVTQRMFDLKMNPADLERVMGESGEAAQAAVQRYEKAVLDLHNAVNADGQKALSASDFWADMTAPKETLASIPGSLAKESEIIQRMAKMEAENMAPIGGAKLAHLEEEMAKVREAIRAERDVGAATTRALGELEKASPGVTQVDDASLDRLLMENGMPNTPKAREIARYHVAEMRVAAASQGESKFSGLGDVLGKGFGIGLSAYVYGQAYNHLGWWGPVAASVIMKTIGKKAGGFKSAADRLLNIGGKAAMAAGAAARKAALPAAIAAMKGKSWSEKIAPIVEMANPQALDQAVREGPVGMMATRDPEFAMQVRNVAWTKYRYLAQTAPNADQPDSPFGGYEYEPSKADQASWMRRVKAADDPQSVLENAADGTVTPEEVETLAAVYPQTYQAIQEYLTENAVELQKKLPYKTRVTLSTLFQSAMEPTARPEMVQAFQASFEESNQPAPKSGTLSALKAPEGTKAQQVGER